MSRRPKHAPDGAILVPGGYGSPRWSQEVLDCSMPMTFDTYSKCSFDCLYCFSYFQPGNSKTSPTRRISGRRNIRAASIERTKRLFLEPETNPNFTHYIRNRMTLQWGGLSDAFDDYERTWGVTLELLRFFASIDYPICFSTKAAWWTRDERYAELFRGRSNWNVKFSIITGDKAKARTIERGCPSPLGRLRAMERVASWGGSAPTLRLRPFIIGVSDPGHCDLIRAAADAGAGAVSTEFFCVEARATAHLKRRYAMMEPATGYDILRRYKRFSKGAGYLRLNRNVKRRFVREMDAACRETGLRFYVSDAHFKEYSCGGSCCGLGEGWTYNRGQFTQALVIAKRTGSVRWSDIAADADWLRTVSWMYAPYFNTGDSEKESRFADFSMLDYMRWAWNNPNQAKSPYRYFEGVLRPVGVDEAGDVIYEYDASKE